MNWKARLTNPSFWSMILISLGTTIYGYMNITAQDLTTWSQIWEVLSQTVQNPYLISSICVNIYSVIYEPTSSGLFTDGE